MTKIKICGLTREEDIRAVNQYKPDYIGFVFAKSRRQVSAEKAMELKNILIPEISAVGVFVNESMDVISEYMNKGIIDLAQLHGNETEEDIVYLKRKTGKPVIKAVSVRTVEDIDAWKDSAADYLLFDNGAGGTGKTFDWKILEESAWNEKPYFIAGGINLENINQVLDRKSFGIDLSGGVETDGIKDPEKIKNIIEIVRAKNRNGE